MFKTGPVLCGMILFALAGALSPAGATDAYQANAEWQLVQLINQARTGHGLAPLHQDLRLQAAARRHTTLMALQNVLSHQLPGESVLGKRLELNGAHSYVAGETAAFNRTADAAHQSFMHSPAHRRIILDSHYDAVGIGVVERDGMVWVTEDFAHLQTE